MPDILTTIAGHPVPDCKNDGGGGKVHPRIIRYSGWTLMHPDYFGGIDQDPVS